MQYKRQATPNSRIELGRYMPEALMKQGVSILGGLYEKQTKNLN